MKIFLTILETAVCSRSSTFVKFYLSHQAENLQSLGPILVAQKVVVGGGGWGATRQSLGCIKLLTASKAYRTYIKVTTSYINVRNKIISKVLYIYLYSYSLKFPES